MYHISDHHIHCEFACFFTDSSGRTTVSNNSSVNNVACAIDCLSLSASTINSLFVAVIFATVLPISTLGLVICYFKRKSNKFKNVI